MVTVINSIDLDDAGNTLFLESVNPHWGKIYLVGAQNKFLLGCEKIEIALEKLSNALSEMLRPAPEASRKLQWVWVWTLSEPRTFLYVSSRTDSLHLSFRDADDRDLKVIEVRKERAQCILDLID